MRTRTSTAALALLSPLLASFASACAEDVAQFDVKFAPEFQKGTISVLGVFKDGRLSPETWDELGPKISPVFGKGLCPIGYDAKLATTQPDLADTIDDYSRANGVTDDLLDQLAPAASGDSVLVVTVAGHPPKAPKDQGISGPPASATPMAPRGGMGGMPGAGGMGGRRGQGGMGTPTPMRPLAVDRNAYQISASLFSLRDHHTTALVSMGYSGQSADEALQKFVAKLQTSLAGQPCVGWNMSAPIDEKKIKALESE
jgi:hypothetical protein